MEGLREKVGQSIGSSGGLGKDYSGVQSTLTVEIQHQHCGRGYVVGIGRIVIVILRYQGQSEEQQEERE